MKDSYLKEYLQKLPKSNLEQIVFAIVKKRNVDGGYGRIWDAHEHYKWEQFLRGFLDNIPNQKDSPD